METWLTRDMEATTTTGQEVDTMLEMSNATTLVEALRACEELGRSLPGCVGGTFRVLDRCPQGAVLGSHEVELRLDADGKAWLR